MQYIDYKLKITLRLHNHFILLTRLYRLCILLLI